MQAFEATSVVSKDVLKFQTLIKSVNEQQLKKNNLTLLSEPVIPLSAARGHSVPLIL